MGGRGTYARGNQVEPTYKTVDMIEDVQVLEGIGRLHNLPVESHSSSAYIKVHPDGNFQMMRIYDDDHYLTKEIAYHPEPDLNGGKGGPVLHAHDYKRDNFDDRPARLLTPEEREKYKKYFRGVKE